MTKVGNFQTKQDKIIYIKRKKLRNDDMLQENNKKNN